MKLYETTVRILVGIPDDTPDSLVFGTLADNVSGVLTDNGVYVDASQPGGPLGIVDWTYARVGTANDPTLDDYGWLPVSPRGVVDGDGFVIEGAFTSR